jgi:hypothetical protein
LALPLSSAMSGRAIEANTRIGAATICAVASGREMARFFGTSSPRTIENAVASTSAAPTATASTTPRGRPTASSGVRRSDATLGSAR